MGSIYRIHPSMLRTDVLRDHLYPNLEQTYYWDDSWDPAFYIELARAGFISIAYADPEMGPLLIPELQGSYAILDWERLHRSRNLTRLLRSQRFAQLRVELRMDGSIERVLERLGTYHDRSWLLEPYRELMLRLPRNGDPHFGLHAVELWSLERDELVAGELGYTVGGTYTSLSGFCSPREREYRGFGTLQMYLLADALRDRGYAFWNMGEPSQPYKQALGARIVPRAEFLERWFAARHLVPSRTGR